MSSLKYKKYSSKSNISTSTTDFSLFDDYLNHRERNSSGTIHSVPQPNRTSTLTNSFQALNAKGDHKVSLDLRPTIEESRNKRNSTNVEQNKEISICGKINSHICLGERDKQFIIYRDGKLFLKVLFSILIIGVMFLSILIASHIYLHNRKKEAFDIGNKKNFTNPNLLNEKMNKKIDENLLRTSEKSRDSELFSYTLSLISKEYKDVNDYNFHAVGVAIHERWFVTTSFLPKHQPYFTQCPRKHEIFARSGSVYWSRGGTLHKVDSIISDDSNNSTTTLILGSVFKSFTSFLQLSNLRQYQKYNHINVNIFGWNFNIDQYDAYSELKHAKQKHVFITTKNRKIILLKNNSLAENICGKSIGFLLTVKDLIIGIQLEPSCFKNADSILFASLPYFIPWIEMIIYTSN